VCTVRIPTTSKKRGSGPGVSPGKTGAGTLRVAVPGRGDVLPSAQTAVDGPGGEPLEVVAPAPCPARGRDAAGLRRNAPRYDRRAARTGREPQACARRARRVSDQSSPPPAPGHPFTAPPTRCQSHARRPITRRARIRRGRRAHVAPAACPISRARHPRRAIPLPRRQPVASRTRADPPHVAPAAVEQVELSTRRPDEHSDAGHIYPHPSPLSHVPLSDSHMIPQYPISCAPLLFAAVPRARRCARRRLSASGRRRIPSLRGPDPPAATRRRRRRPGREQLQSDPAPEDCRSGQRPDTAPVRS